MLPPGHRIKDEYEVVALAAQGGMALVYQVRHITSGTLYALKLLIHSLPKQTHDFHHEANLMIELGHPNVPRVTDMGTIQGFPFIIMEWLDGETLEARLARERTIQLDAVLEICRQIGDVLAHVHPRGVVHRDLKPANIFVLRMAPGVPAHRRPANFVKVLDFGIARVPSAARARTVQGTVMGTAEYMAPEQARGDVAAIDARSDQYGLAMIAYTMLRGQPAFTLRSPGTVAELAAHFHAVVYDPPPPLPGHVPVAVAAVLMRALRKSPQDRYGNVEDFMDALVAAQQCGATSPTMRSRTMAAVVGPSPELPAAFPSPGSSPAVGEVLSARRGTESVDPAEAASLPVRTRARSAREPAELNSELQHCSQAGDTNAGERRPPPGSTARWSPAAAKIAIGVILLGLVGVLIIPALSKSVAIPESKLLSPPVDAAPPGPRVNPDLASAELSPGHNDHRDLGIAEDQGNDLDVTVRDLSPPPCPPLFTARCIHGRGLTSDQRNLFAEVLNRLHLRLCSKEPLFLRRDDSWFAKDWDWRLPNGMSDDDLKELLGSLYGYWRVRKYNLDHLPEKVNIACP